jgi:hypothetical protein
MTVGRCSFPTVRPPISNKLLGTSIVNFQFLLPFRRKLRLLGLRCSTMGHFFVVPWLTPSRPTLAWRSWQSWCSGFPPF